VGLFSFGSKKGKMRKLIEEERFDEVVGQVLKGGKNLQTLLELLDDPNPGIVGDALLLLTNVLRESPETLAPLMNTETFQKLLSLMESRNPYVRENAMLLSYEIVKTFPEVVEKYRDWIVRAVERGLEEGGKDQKGFLLLVIEELELRELVPKVEELVNVEDKVILPFEGRKWVKLGDIAREVLERLS